MSHLKYTTVSVIVEALGRIKKGIYKHINNIAGSPSLFVMQKLHFAELLIFF